MADSHTCPANPAHTTSVRLALPTEATAIAEIQQRAWADDPDLAVLTDEVSSTDAVTAWSEAIMRPPMADFRVLVAVEPDKDGEAEVRGFAAIGPSEDADAEHTDALVAEFAVDPRHRGQGHGSRLLNAVVDTLRADRFTRATWWIRTGDDATRRFLTEAGWGADGAHRETGTEDEQIRIKEVRLHTVIAAD